MARMIALCLSCLLLGVAAAASAPRFGCKGTQGEDVDWFIFYKLPVSYYIAYMDSSNVTWTKLKKPITDVSQPVGFTLDQVYKNKSEIFGFYNDGLPPNGSAPSTFFYGHAKGAFAFDSTSGFWLIHSVPRFPFWSPSYAYPSTGYPFGQVGLCLSLKTDSLKQLESVFHYIHPWVYDSSISSAFSKLYPAFSRILASSNSSVANASAPNALVPLTTIGGLQVQSFAKHSSFNAELYSSWVAPTLMTGLSVESWLRDESSAKTNSLPSTCAGKYPVYNVRNMTLGKGMAFASIDDHSKWSISTDSSLPWVCIGDINRQSSQARRSGGTNCFQHAQVWNAFHNAIAETDPCTTRK